MPAKKVEVAAHKHDELSKEAAALKKEIAALKKEVAAIKSESAALKNQCHSCCGDLASLKKEIHDLKDRPAGGRDNRINVLVDALNNAGSIELKRLLRSKIDLLK